MYYTCWMLHQAKTERKRFTDKLPTGYRHITNSRPTVGQQVAYISDKTCRPSVSQLSADKRPTVGQLSADRRPTVGRQTTNCRPTVDRQLTNSRLTGFLGSSSSQLPMTWLPTQPSIVPLLLVLSLSNKIKCF